MADNVRGHGAIAFVLLSALGPAVGLLTGTITAASLTPRQFGAFQIAGLALPYLTIVGLGIYQGLSRQYPFLMGRNEPEKALALVGASWIATKWMTLAIVVASVAYAAVLTARAKDATLIIAAWATVPIVCLYPLTTFLEVLFRTRSDFGRFALIQGLGYLMTVLTLLIVVQFQFPGQCLRLNLIALVGLGLRWRWRPIRTWRDGDWAGIHELIGTGAPFLLAGYLYGVYLVADRTILAITLGAEQVGYYSLAGIVVTAMSALPMALMQVILPRASADLGRVGTYNALRRYVWLSVGAGSLLLVPAAAAGWYLLPTLVARAMPNYLPGLEAARISLITGVIGAPGLTSLFLVLQRSRVYVALVCLSTGVVCGGSLLALKNGGTIETVAWVRVGSTAFLSVFGMWYALRLTRTVACGGASPRIGELQAVAAPGLETITDGECCADNGSLRHILDTAPMVAASPGPAQNNTFGEEVEVNIGGNSHGYQERR